MANLHHKIGISLDKKVTLKFDWTGLGEKLANTVAFGIGAVLGEPTSGLRSVSSLIGLAGTLKKESSEGSQALELIILCFAWSIDEVRAMQRTDQEEVGEAARTAAFDAIKILKTRVDSGDQTIPYDFFDQPTSAEPYQLLRDHFLKKRTVFRVSARENEKILKARLDTAFRAAVFHLLLAESSRFPDVTKALNLTAAKTADFDRQWKAYREHLIHQFEVEPVFGQSETKISLGQVYIPLRCQWRETKNTDDEKTQLQKNLEIDVKEV